MNSEKIRIQKEFGKFIREARKKRGLRQEDVAEQVGLSRGYYCLIETGGREVYFTTAIRICRTLGLNFYDFEKDLK